MKKNDGAVPKVMSATLNVVVSINSTTVMQTYWTAPYKARTIYNFIPLIKDYALSFNFFFILSMQT